MYTFSQNGARRRDKHALRLMRIVICILAVALAVVVFSYVRLARMERGTAEAIASRAISEAQEAQSAVYRLTQSSGANTSALLAVIRSHVYALQSLNVLAAGIYGPDTAVADSAMLSACIDTISECETRVHAGLMLTDLYTQLRDDVDQIAAAFGA